MATPAGIRHTLFHRLGDQLSAGDVLVVNTSATVPGQLDGSRDGSAVVVHIANRLGDGSRVVELRTAPDASAPVLDGRVGEDIALPAGGVLELLAPYPQPNSSPTGVGNRLWRGRLTAPQSLSDYLREQARPISYGYLNGSFPISAYQTIFALCPGSAEMPSAARPFSAELVARLVSREWSSRRSPCTPACPPKMRRGPQPEWFEVSETTAHLVNSSRARGGRVIAVGTTATAPSSQPPSRTGWWQPLGVDRPGDLPGATGTRCRRADHRMAQSGGVAPAAGRVCCRRRADQRAYDAAVAEHYLWHEFGDSGLLMRTSQDLTLR